MLIVMCRLLPISYYLLPITYCPLTIVKFLLPVTVGCYLFPTALCGGARGRPPWGPGPFAGGPGWGGPPAPPWATAAAAVGPELSAVGPGGREGCFLCFESRTSMP